MSKVTSAGDDPRVFSSIRCRAIDVTIVDMPPEFQDGRGGDYRVPSER